MSSAMVDSLMSQIPSQVFGSIASQLGETNDSVERGLQSASASMLGAIASRSSDSSFLNQIYALVTSPANDEGLLSNLGSMMSLTGKSSLMDLGSRFLSLLFGSNQTTVGETVARSAGMRTGSATGLLSMAAPLVLSFLGKRVKQEGLSATSLGSILGRESSALAGMIPAGLTSMLAGTSRMAGSAASAAEAAAGRGSRWLWPALILLAAVLGLTWLLSNRQPATTEEAARVGTPATTTTTSTTGGAIDAIEEAARRGWAALGELVPRKLPNGIELNIPRSGVENRIIEFIADSNKRVDTTTWFDFDRILFDTGKSTIRPVSREQLTNVANILKAYPNVHAKIGGYTDNVGDPQANMQLSAERAKAVVNELVAMGIEPSRLESEGYGDQHPVADNTTEEGRAKNRRVSMRVTQK